MRRIQRRTFLKGAGVAIGLPFLEASLPSRSDAANSEGPIRRMVLMEFGFGFYAPYLIPKKIGYDYELTPYLEVLKEFRQDLTIISGTSHPDVDGGHLAVKSFLTAAPKPRSTSFKNTISVDQLAAERIGIETRFRSLTLGGSISYSRNGAQIPAEHSPSRLFAKLFLDGSLQERQRQIQRLKDQQSVMDAVLDEARSMRTRASK